MYSILDAAVRRARKAAARPLPAEMTVAQAADFLGMARALVIKLIKCGELPYRKVGRRRRIPTTALQEYHEKWFQEAKEVMDELTRLSQEIGLYDLEGPPPRRDGPQAR